MDADLLFRPITELGRLVSDGELSARELVETSLRRIEDLDGDVNAFTHVHAEEALAAADAVKPGDPRPFAGVPVAIKTEVAVQGSPLTFGSQNSRDGRNGSRDVEVSTTGMPITPSSIFFFAATYPASKRR